MSVGNRDKASWRIDFPQAALDTICGSLAATLDVTAPSGGLHAIELADRHLRGYVLAATITPGPPLKSDDIADTYARGDDIVVSYAESAERNCSCQFYWQSTPSPLDPSARTMLTLMASVQTSGLDSEPQVLVSTSLDADSIVVDLEDGSSVELTSSSARAERFEAPRRASAITYRLGDGDWRYLELVEGGEIRSLDVRRDEGRPWTTTWTLFGEFLEKGVIRRTRTHGLFVRQEQLAARPHGVIDYVRSLSPPLTT